MDATYWQALGLGLTNILEPKAFGFLLLGVSVGLVIGALPAIGGVTGLIILLPFTYSLSGTEAFALLLGMYSTVAAGDAISSILVGVPGGVGSSATILDGYPLAKRGQAARALGAAYTSCALGGLVGAFILALSIPVVKPLVLVFGMPEYFALAVLGLAMAGTLVGKSLTKGVAMACLGLLISAVGASDFSGIPRFWFEISYLVQQPPIVAVVLGLFGIAEMLDLAISRSKIARGTTTDLSAGGTLQGIRDTIREWWLVLRCSAIGVYIGLLPGVGATVVDWAAYGHAVQSSKDKSGFGKGDIRGVIAPEVANNADRGGALVPTLAFGIPGDFAMAILLGALTIQGLKPGVEMLTTQLPITFTMIWAIVIANIIGAALLMLWSRHIAKIAFVDSHIIVPAVLFFILMGAWLGTTTMGDLVVMLIAGVIGYWMKIAGWPRPPLIIGLVLGNMMENSLVVSMRTYDGFSFLLRPAVLIILGLTALTVVLAVRAQIKARRKQADSTGEPTFAGDLVEDNPMFSLPFAVVLAGAFAAAVATALQMRKLDAAFPIWAAACGLLCALVAIRTDTQQARQTAAGKGWRAALKSAAQQVRLGLGALFLLHIALTVLGVYLFGHTIAIPLALGLYVLVWGRYAWWAALSAGLAAFAAVELLYNRVLNINLQPALWWS